MNLAIHSKILRGCLDFQFPLPITLFPSPITQNMWVPWLTSVFDIVSSFYFHHSILWFLNDELWKLSYDDILVIKHSYMTPLVLSSQIPFSLPPVTLSFLSFFFTLLSFSLLLYMFFFLFFFRAKSHPSKDKRILALPIHDLSSLICLSFFVLHPSHANPSDEQLTNVSQSQTH